MAENELKDDGVRLQNRWKTGHWDMKELDASMNMLQRVGARKNNPCIQERDGPTHAMSETNGPSEAH
uniref:Uncharacterized protein n=1 Tax=Oryza rufipogon TaxID=4529 RepID=A0A0E0MV59_ORYRU